MKLRFTKMHGAGNDFVVIDGVRQRVVLSTGQWRRLADRRFGVGADQILLVEPPPAGAGVDFRYRIFNADGGEVEQCGNGARCFVRFVVEQGLTDKRVIRVATLGGIIEPRLEDDGRVTVDMGPPGFEPARIPFDAEGLAAQAVAQDAVWQVPLAGVGTRALSVVSMGNPHAVQFVDDVDAAPVAEEGPVIEHSPRFPARVNAGFAQVVAGRLRLRVWERGVGETLACGTGACAAAVAAVRRGLVQSPVAVEMRGGTLSIAWEGRNVLMTGPAATVFEGEVDLAALLPPGSE